MNNQNPRRGGGYHNHRPPQNRNISPQRMQNNRYQAPLTAREYEYRRRQYAMQRARAEAARKAAQKRRMYLSLALFASIILLTVVVICVNQNRAKDSTEWKENISDVGSGALQSPEVPEESGIDSDAVDVLASAPDTAVTDEIPDEGTKDAAVGSVEETLPDVPNEEEKTESASENTAVINRIPVKYKSSSYIYNADTVADLTDEIECNYGALIRLSDGVVVAAKNYYDRIYPASMTKIMTLIVAYENITDYTAEYTMTNTIIDPQVKAGASITGLSAGETVTLLDLMYGVALPSGADATCALADYICGSEAKFVELMNQKVKALGLTHTHFENCSGLHHDNHYSTTYEIAKILEYALSIDMCREILSTYRYTTTPSDKHPEGVMLESTMFSRIYGDEPEGAEIFAGKTGYTIEARHCLASYAEMDDKSESYIFVTADGETRWKPIFDSIHVYSEYR